MEQYQSILVGIYSKYNFTADACNHKNMNKLLKPFLYAQYIWKPITEMYIASPLWVNAKRFTSNISHETGLTVVANWRCGRGDLVETVANW